MRQAARPISLAGPINAGEHYVVLLNGRRVVAKVLSLTASGTQDTVTVAPCQHTMWGTFRQLEATAITHVVRQDFQLGPFPLTMGRAPSFVTEHLQQEPWWPLQSVWTPQAPRQAAESSDPHFSFAAQMQAIEDMGFTPRSEAERIRLQSLLDELNGDVWNSVNTLLAEREQHPSVSSSSKHAPGGLHRPSPLNRDLLTTRMGGA